MTFSIEIFDQLTLCMDRDSYFVFNPKDLISENHLIVDGSIVSILLLEKGCSAWRVPCLGHCIGCSHLPGTPLK